MFTNNVNAAADLFPRMEGHLQDAFLTCYKTYGKVATKKLLSCVRQPAANQAIQQIIALTGYDVPAPPPKFWSIQGEKIAPEWLAIMPVGPGVSPCVNNTCRKLLSSEQTITTLVFLECLCDTAIELKRAIQTNQVDVADIIRQVSNKAQKLTEL